MAEFPFHRARGFTLIEMSIVLLIIAAVLSSGLAVFTASIDKRQYDETNAKITILEKALLDYRRAWKRLPCPADVTQAPTAAEFGVAATGEGSCTGGTPAANFSDGFNTVGGMVPTKALKLPDDMAFDGWGRRIMYFIDRRYSVSNAFVTYPITDTTTGSLTVNDASGAARTTKAIYVLLSFGPNGHGGYTRVGGSSRLNANSANTDEQTNCHCDATAAATAFSATFVQRMLATNPANALDSFDDILAYHVRSDMPSLTE